MRSTWQGYSPPTAATGVSAKRCARSRTVTLCASLSADADTLAFAASDAPSVHCRSLRATRRLRRRSRLPATGQGAYAPAPLGKSLLRPTQRGSGGVYRLMAHTVARTQQRVLECKLVRPLSRQLIAARRALAIRLCSRNEQRSLDRKPAPRTHAQSAT